MKKENKESPANKSLRYGPDYEEQLNSLQENARKSKAQIYFVNEEFKPLAVNKNKIATCKNAAPFANQIAHLPRVGDCLLVNEKDVYSVLKVLHCLPATRSEPHRIFIMIS